MEVDFGSVPVVSVTVYCDFQEYTTSASDHPFGFDLAAIRRDNDCAILPNQ